MNDPKIIDGKKLALEHEKVLKEKIGSLKIKPKIVSILVGDDPASVLYSKIKQSKAEELGIDFELKRFSLTPPGWQAVVGEIKKLNEDNSVHGIMVQFPLPEEFLGSHNEAELLQLIDSKKDVDGLNYARKTSTPVPAAVKAVLSILEDEGIGVKDKRVAVLGRSDLVGKPIAQELIKMGAEVAVGHSQTPDLKTVTQEADILISAMGVPRLVKGDMVKDGVVVIDVGTEKVDGKVVGDVDFESVYPKASKITPVPGGVGPMTVISLMENVVELVDGG